jgi:hypothetical protein
MKYLFTILFVFGMLCAVYINRDYKREHVAAKATLMAKEIVKSKQTERSSSAEQSVFLCEYIIQDKELKIVKQPCDLEELDRLVQQKYLAPYKQPTEQKPNFLDFLRPGLTVQEYTNAFHDLEGSSPKISAKYSRTGEEIILSDNQRMSLLSGLGSSIDFTQLAAERGMIKKSIF